MRVTRTQSLRLAKFKIDKFLKKHQRLLTREQRLRNIVQLFDYLSSSEASILICRYSDFGHIIVEKLSDLTSEGFCPELAAHYFREIFEKRVSQLKYPLPPDIQLRKDACLCHHH